MDHFLTSVDWSRTCPLQLLENGGDIGRRAFVCSCLFGFFQRYGSRTVI